MNINEEAWLEDVPGIPPEMGVGSISGSVPQGQPDGPNNPMGAADPNIPQQGAPPQQQPQEQPPEDISQDPQYPEMPEEDEDKDFEQWKMDYFKQSIKGNPKELEEILLQVRDKDLDANPSKFVEDNLQICFLRQHQDILLPSQEIRRLIKDQLDRNAPATSLVNYITETLSKYPLLNQVYIKFNGTGGGKQDLHRKFIGGLLGAVQVGSGAANEDIIFEETDYSIRISTRFNAKWGDVNLGKWSLREDDAERYLKPAEVQRLEGGSPEEKDVLRRRVIMESIAELYKDRAFIINVVGNDGNIQHLGLDLGNCLKTAYLDGKLVCRTKDNDNLDAFISEDGTITSIPHLTISYIKNADNVNDKGDIGTEELEFLDHRNGSLYLVATMDLVKESATVLNGMSFKETPWTGNPTDLKRIARCVFSVPEQLLRQC
jgi:hypothetical protein